MNSSLSHAWTLSSPEKAGPYEISAPLRAIAREEAQAELTPLWAEPAPMGHNGGPPLELPQDRRSMAERSVGRPTRLTEEVRDRILELLLEGVPLRVIWSTPGMPSENLITGRCT
jgi:hypothetical protein